MAGSTSDRTFFFNIAMLELSDEQTVWSDGPELPYGRTEHSCATLTMDINGIIIFKEL